MRNEPEPWSRKMETEVPEKNQEEITDNGSDWDNRVLCSDGNCIGVIGSDGHCNECGKKYEGDLPEMSRSENEDQTVAEDVNSSSATTEMPEATEIPEVSAAPVDDKWENRVLCSDGNCIGVIGLDGKCKECGKHRE
jgi:hypothetical protein